MKTQKELILKGKTAVLIDWANVYGWRKSLRREIDIEKLFAYLKTYKEIQDIRLYFGRDTHIKSGEFLQNAVEIGYSVITKPVKYIFVTQIEEQKIYRRKCDFDIEICIDVHQLMGKEFESYIFFTGDGDFEPLYRMLINNGKQVIVIYAHGHLGREIYKMRKGLYKRAINSMGDLFL